jgi:protein farnesyltransferase/geranylgeranyltransferase type-1 subunit alpha
MEYFRAIVKAEEYSPRALELTLHIIRLNPSHYSVWLVRSLFVSTVTPLMEGRRQYRYKALLQTDAPLEKELELMNTLMAQNLKSYQIWHHRRLLQGHLRKPFEELAFITKSLTPREMLEHSEEESETESDKDAKVCDNPPPSKVKDVKDKSSQPQKPVDTKNYHTWAYRQWLLAEFNSPELWAGELDFIEMMLRHDVRNNSAWHHRFFVVWESGVREGETDREEVLRREIE